MKGVAIWGPPVVLLLVGTAAYIAVVKLTTPKPITISAQPHIVSPQGSDSAQASTSADAAISTQVSLPDSTEIAAWQAAADDGSEVWRLDVLSAAKHLSKQYGFVDDDAFSMQSSDTTASTVQAAHGSYLYSIMMYQPGLKGDKGVWSIKSIGIQ